MIARMKNFRLSVAAVAAISISLAPCVSAQTTLDQQKRTAKILSDGTIETGAGWITSVSHTSGGGYYVLNFAKPFTAGPNCVVTPDVAAGSGIFPSMMILSTQPNDPQLLNSLPVYAFISNTLAAVDVAFRVSCIPDQTVGTSTASWDSLGTQTSGSDWVTVAHTSTGIYTATFTTRYLSTPNCLATLNQGYYSTVEVVPSTTTVTVYTQYAAGLLPSLQDRAVTIMCSGRQ